MAFDGVKIGLSDGLAKHEGFLFVLAHLFGHPGTEPPAGAFQQCLLPGDRNHLDAPARPAELLPKPPVGLSPGVQLTTGSHAGVDVDKYGRLRPHGNRRLEGEIVDLPLGQAGVDPAGEQLSPPVGKPEQSARSAVLWSQFCPGQPSRSGHEEPGESVVLRGILGSGHHLEIHNSLEMVSNRQWGHSERDQSIPGLCACTGRLDKSSGRSCRITARRDCRRSRSAFDSSTSERANASSEAVVFEL